MWVTPLENLLAKHGGDGTRRSILDVRLEAAGGAPF
jgi:hypothetical protein